MLTDLLAAMSVAGLLLPEALAYSSIAHLAPQAGVIALLIGLTVYAMLGTSRFAIVSATSSSAAVVAAATAALLPEQPGLRAALAAGLVIMAGLALMGAAAARLGAVSSFVSKPVLRGFAFGLALTIAIHQLPYWFGVQPHAPSIAAYLWELLRRWREWHWPDLTMGAGALALLFLMDRWPRWPAALGVLALGTAVAQGDLFSHVARVGVIELGLARPSVPHLPEADWARLGEMSFAMVLVLFAESYASIRNAALRHGDATSPNRDLLALGVANLFSGLFQGMPVAAGFSATAANEASGPQSRWAGAMAAALVLGAAVLLLPVIAWIPECVLAAVVIHAVSHSLNPAVFRPYIAWQRDRLVLVASVLAVLLLGVLDGLLVAMGASLMLALRDLTQSRVSELVRFQGGHAFVDRATHPDGAPEPGMLILRPEAPLFFASADGLMARIMSMAAARPDARIVILSLEETPDLDGTGLEALRDLAAQLARQQVQLRLTRLREPVIALLQRARLPGLSADVVVAPSVDDAVRGASDRARPPAG